MLQRRRGEAYRRDKVFIFQTAFKKISTLMTYLTSDLRKNNVALLVFEV